jgi:hypothetical protein
LKTKRHQKNPQTVENKLKVALHLVHSNSFSTKKRWHVFNFDHRWRITLIQKKTGSQEYIGPLILEKIQMYILTRAELLYTLCYETPCTKNHLMQLHKDSSPTVP